MERSSDPDLVARVARLEGSRRLHRAVIAAVAILAVATAQTPSGGSTSAPTVVRDASGASATLTSQGLTVRDAAGHTRVFAGVDADGRPSVDLADGSGQLRESMYLLAVKLDNGSAAELPILRQFDAKGKRRAEMRLDNTEDGELLLDDASETIRAALFRTKSGDPQLGLYGSDAKLRAFFSTDDDSPYLVMKDAAGTTRVYAGGYTDGSIGLSIRNAADTVLWKAP
jgi:hypothetical protein